MIYLYNKQKIKSGDKYSCILKGIKISGIIYINNNFITFYHNAKELYGGSAPIPTGLKYSYTCSIIFNQVYNFVIDKVIYCDNLIIEGKDCKREEYFIQTENLSSYLRVSLKHVVFNPYKKTDFLCNNVTRLFYMKEHPDCCGSILLYGFDEAPEDNKEYSRFAQKLLPNEEIIELIKDFCDDIKPAKLIHLAAYQYYAKLLVLKIGFKDMFSYTNKNSGREITVYHKN